jgi:hypothetical protein
MCRYVAAPYAYVRCFNVLNARESAGPVYIDLAFT